LKSTPNGIEGNYGRDVEQDDSRFVDNFSAVESIATSHAQNDSGMFELNFRDDRFLPFEGAGVISRWRRFAGLAELECYYNNYFL
jgi:hypothetical protein